MSTETKRDLNAYKQEIDLIFHAAANASFNIPEQYRIALMKGVLYFAMEKLHCGAQEDTDIIRDAFNKWTGEEYEDSDDEDEVYEEDQ
jgi:hypothetical protein